MVHHMLKKYHSSYYHCDFGSKGLCFLQGVTSPPGMAGGGVFLRQMLVTRGVLVWVQSWLPAAAFLTCERNLQGSASRRHGALGRRAKPQIVTGHTYSVLLFIQNLV